MIRARSGKACAVLRRDASDVNSARSTSSSPSGAKPRPIASPPKNKRVSYDRVNSESAKLQIQDTRRPKERAMSEAVVDDIVAVLPPLLQSLEALGFVARHLNPPDFDSVMEAAGTPDQALQAVRSRLADWPEQFASVRNSLEAASDAALAAFAGLREVQHGNGDMIAVFRALRHASRAQEALYPLAAKLPPVSDFFVDPRLREDAGLKARLA